MAKVGIIGGSGLYDIEGIGHMHAANIMDTPFGTPSDQFMIGRLGDVEVVFLSRHGKGHKISPSEINYRANIFGMKKLGVDAILSVSACGSLKEEIKPLDFVIPDQLVDRTLSARESTFFEGGIVAHVGFADPLSHELREILIESAKEIGVGLHEKGTYITMEGPQFSTKAESNLYRTWGMDIIGMTNVTEAKLAREAEISYATLAAVTDYDCWHDSHESVTVDMIIGNLTKNIAEAKKILRIAIPKVAALTEFSAQNSLQHAIITDRDKIPELKKRSLGFIIDKYIM
ncbi:MAG: methylthioadenosine phosphorylase [Omnitrophica WOR_2 bacterium GWF2_38_59]|nr:MAG: methylthioadenosine phosphorylase [Omnitrophica WOR_2 bacterium GWF2_38_59]OGX47960.1 MAG: methylthioadenosine phosphorylase [Omnitrophica WOR_2 bacterium RIFOXYA2_FULL_38_17]OGX51794.1 MAG: methylthioadenosine phosphorylase [Omnitrophica WOR_2 bacterium RIFOXYA12_FULL_38_10]OGX56297.1 MAG: methylthioadenosine phosphorylase [Omnitrophica WOR_2 bacterium RIFOXYC2_FULL_38_12]OGX60198.1 MAG: methylthioadenosine phosphorylase [Omnitrophica WOR_2 bacterium RIFOXYB2_FULL_38_16]HBG61075.1 S-m